MKIDEYDRMFRVEDRHWWYRGLRTIIQNAWDRHGLKEGANILDIGCGTGANLALLAPKATATGIDISTHALDRCASRGLARNVQASADALPFPAQHFDAALIIDVLYHQSVSDKQRPLEEAHRILKPGGLVFINVPAYQWLYSSHDDAIQTDRRFTRREIVTLLRAAGFNSLHATYWNTLLFPPILLARLWRKMRPTEGSDLNENTGGFLPCLFSAALAIERRLMAIAPLPFGLSIFVVARKP